MSSILWIPCYNEWDQEVEYRCLKSSDIIRTTRHTLYETLNLLKQKIQIGIFDEIVITDDGSTDNTREGIVKFLRENWISNRKLRVIWSVARMWKMDRFFEIIDIISRSWTEVLTMTDADMVDSWGDTFNLLSRPPNEFAGAMLVSQQAEYFPADKAYKIFGHKSSGTRSVIVSRAQQIFQREWFSMWNIPGTWYGLELFLNSFLWMRYINQSHIPHFLVAERKWLRQSIDIRRTEFIISLLKPLTIKDVQITLSKTEDGLIVSILLKDWTKRDLKIEMSEDNYITQTSHFWLQEKTELILELCFQNLWDETPCDDTEKDKLRMYLYWFNAVHYNSISTQ